MRLPVIKAITEYAIQSPENLKAVEGSIEVLEQISAARGVKDEELDVIGELISNLCGGIEVANLVASGADQREALNGFMQRVLGSIDK